MSQGFAYWKDYIHKVMLQLADDAKRDGRRTVSSRSVTQALQEMDDRSVRAMAVEWMVNEVESYLRGGVLSQEKASELRATPDVISKQKGWWEGPKGRAMQARRDREYEEHKKKWSDKKIIVVDKLNAEVLLDLNKRLLKSAFALGDGTSVQWGEATKAQHEARLELLMKNVEGNLDTANRHRAAIEMLIDTQKKTLNEVAEMERKSA